ncbi:MAG: hypothetical protein WAM52_23210 [Steroidobacteraceae bacterium]
MFEWSSRCLCARVDAISNRAALHEDDRVMAILARYGGRETHREPRLGPTSDQLEAARRQVVTFIDNELAVISDAIVHHALAD